MADTPMPFTAGNFTIHNSFSFWISRLNSILQESFNQQLSAYQVTWSQWLVLNILHHQMAGTPAQIAEEMGVDRSAVTRLLDRLEDKAYIERQHDKLDRRSVNIRLTGEGAKLMEELNQRAYDHQQAFLVDLHRSERRGFKGELQKILRASGIETTNIWQRAD